MMDIVSHERGLFSLIARPDADQTLIAIAQRAITLALTEFASGGMPQSVTARFKPSAFGLMNYTRRTDAYTRRQTKILGAATPYVSPRRITLDKLLLAAVKPTASAVIGAAKDLARQSTKAFAPHLRDQITIPGIGWHLRISGRRQIRIKLVHPAARILNRAKGGQYAREFTDLRRGGQDQAIMSRAQHWFDLFLGARLRQAA